VAAVLRGGHAVERQQIVGTIRRDEIVGGHPPPTLQHINTVGHEQGIDGDLLGPRPDRATSARQTWQGAAVSAALAGRARLATASARQAREAASIAAASWLPSLGVKHRSE
jgi:hypothetical protein